MRGGRLKSSRYASYSSHSEPLHKKPIFHYIIVLLIIATLAVGILALINTYQLKKALIPKRVDINDFLKKLTSHDEAKDYVGVIPLNIVQINNDNIANLQTQINGLDLSYIKDFIVQYADRIVIYDYDKDEIKGSISLQQQAEFPDDFFTKLNKHAELEGLQNEQPTGGQLDETSLNTLRLQFPDVYANAKVGDFLLRYDTKLIIYDYIQDKIINAVSLS